MGSGCIDTLAAFDKLGYFYRGGNAISQVLLVIPGFSVQLERIYPQLAIVASVSY